MKLKNRIFRLAIGLFKRVQSLYERIERWAEKSLQNEEPSKRSSAYYFNVGWWILKLGLGGFLIWAFLAPLDRGVTASGIVVSDGQRKTVQAQVSGTVDQILVREDQAVSSGELLIKLNDVNATAGSNLSGETISGLNLQIAKSEQSITHKKNQLKVLQTQISNANALAAEGYLPRNRVLEMQQNADSLKANIAQEEADNENLKRIRAEESQKKTIRDQELKWTDIVAPVSGTIVNLQVFTQGAYLPAGAKLLEIVPDDAGLVAEAELPVNLIDKVAEGMQVRLLFSAFNQNRTPQVPGVLTLVGNDRLTNPETRKPYYKIQAKVTNEGLEMLSGLHIKAGMPVEVFVKTGERTFVSYLLKPIMDRLSASLREH
jgi:membrane fusion protein, protease secretion system